MKKFKILICFLIICFCFVGCGGSSGGKDKGENNTNNEADVNANQDNNQDDTTANNIITIKRLKPKEDNITLEVGEELPLEVTEIQEYSYSWTLETNGVPNIIATSADSVWIPDESDVGSHKIYCSVLDESFIEIYVDSIVDVTVKAKPIDPPPPPPPISGCANPEAANYNPDAEVDCCCVIYGCTNPKAINYNPNATDNDGSCIFPPPPPPQKGLADTCWPMHDHDIRRSGIASCTGATTFNVKWQTTANLHDHSCIAVDESGIIYLAELDGVSSLSLENGSQNWKFQSNELVRFTGPTILKNDDIYIAAVKTDGIANRGYLLRIDSQGNKKSQFECDNFTYKATESPENFVACPPIISADESFLFGSCNPSTLVGGYDYFDSQGNEIGDMNGNRGFNGFGTPATIEFSEQLPIFFWLSQPKGWTGLSGEVLGCRPRTGTEEFYFTQKFYSADYAKTQPRISGNNIIIGTSHEVICYEYTGITSLKWSVYKNVTNFIIYGNSVIASGSTGLSSYSLSNGSPIWNSSEVVDAIELVGDNANHIYALLSNKIVCFSSENGSILWSKDFSEPTEHGTLAIAPEKLIAIRSDCNQIVCFGN